jgi:hypothetical protein
MLPEFTFVFLLLALSAACIALSFDALVASADAFILSTVACALSLCSCVIIAELTLIIICACVSTFIASSYCCLALSLAVCARSIHSFPKAASSAAFAASSAKPCAFACASFAVCSNFSRSLRIENVSAL